MAEYRWTVGVMSRYASGILITKYEKTKKKLFTIMLETEKNYFYFTTKLGTSSFVAL